MAPSICPICHASIHPTLAPLLASIEPYMVRQLSAGHAGWNATAGACPECLHSAVRQAEAGHSATSIHASLHIPYPVYSPDATGLLPTPERVRANPHFSGRGVTIAFLDSGFYPHADLVRPNNRILAHYDATGGEVVERKRFKSPRATSWHGLMTASIAAGSGHLSQGRFRGVAPGASLLLVKTGNPRRRGISERDIGRALRWVIDNRERYNVRVVNISLGGDQPGGGKLTELDALTEEAAARGMVVVAAAGNSGAERILPPASAPSALTVGGLDDGNSLDRRRHRLWHSSYGRGAFGVPKPEVVAPAIWLAAPMLPKTATHNEALFMWRAAHAADGELARMLASSYGQARFRKDTLSLPPQGIRRVVRDYMVEQKYIHPHYQHVDGTSMAAPIVSGVAAQMIEANPSLSPAQIRERIKTTARILPDASPEKQGRGVINAAKAVAAAMRAPGGPMRGLPISPFITDEYVTFYLHAPRAGRVALVGTFNGWNPAPMQEVFAGAWRVSVPRLPSGEYRYKFLLDDARWTHDPENANVAGDGLGGYNSLLIVE